MTGEATTETRTTLAFAVAAVALVWFAWITAPQRVIPAALQDRGAPFFPSFVDPNAAASLEVVDFDPQAVVPRAFKVQNRDGRWTIPSHDNYPADARDRLSSIAAAVISLRRDDIVSDDVNDHERCGVLDPQDVTLPATEGRGTRITVKGSSDSIIADIIVGREVDSRPSFRYVRLPEQRRTYISRVEGLDVSTRFEDWIEPNLLVVDREDIDQIIIRNYITDGKSGTVTPREMSVLRKIDRDTWQLDGASRSRPVNSYRVNLLVTKLADLAIVDVRPKPPGVTASLTASGDRPLQRADVADLAGKGFYFSADGSLLSNQGEVVIHTASGIFYVLRFGAIAYEPSDSRFLFISVGIDPNAVAGTAADRVSRRLDVLRARFAPWYYLVSNISFRDIRLSRSDLLSPSS